MDVRVERIQSAIKTYPDFPKKGVVFRDVFPIFEQPIIMKDLVDVLVDHIQSLEVKPEAIVGLEARGFILGPLMSLQLSLPFYPIRKKGKLPGPVKSMTYQLEYGSDSFEVSTNAIKPGTKCILVDDLLATGGSLKTSIDLLHSIEASVVEALVLIELHDLKGRHRLNVPVFSVVTY